MVHGARAKKVLIGIMGIASVILLSSFLSTSKSGLFLVAILCTAFLAALVVVPVVLSETDW